MNVLIVIPARGGSKGIPHKNIKELGGKPLIFYTIDVARQIVSDDFICVSTDDPEISEKIERYGLHIPFKRPEELATDFAGTNEVVLHALSFYEERGKHIDVILLLQPTSPFRKKTHIEEALLLYDSSIDMVVSVKEAASNPYYNSFEENVEGWLVISKGDGNIERRQDAPKAWEFNGSIYVINPHSLKEKGMNHFSKIRKYQMDDCYSIDLDTLFDWKVAEVLLDEKLID